jgi:hypothetical protein
LIVPKHMSLTGTVVTHLFAEDINKLKERLIRQRLDLPASIEQHRQEGSCQPQAELLELARIDGALARIAAGVYGLCTRCGIPIVLRRLRAIPAAEFCLDCQMLFEQQRNHYPEGR